MHNLITGHRGFIGSRLHSKTLSIGIDLQDGQNLLTCELPKDINIIYHLAAQTSVEASWGDPLHDLDNIRMIARLVKEYPDKKIIYANSAAAIPPISSPYGFSKWVGAEYLKNFHNNYVICTFPNIYGGGKSVVDIFKKYDEITVYGDGSHTRDYVHVDDIIDGLLRAQEWEIGEYQMGSGISTAVIDLVKPWHVVQFAPERKEAKESVLRNDTPNWVPKINIHDYLT